MSRYHSRYSQDKVSSSNGSPAYHKDGGRKLDDTETQPPYNANIGPGGPDMNTVGFPMVKQSTKQKMSPYMNAAGMVPSVGTPAASLGAGTDWTSIGKAIGSGSQAAGSAIDSARQPGTLPGETASGATSGGPNVRYDQRIRRMYE